MKASIKCPPPEELRRLLEGSLSGERQNECTDHLDSCESCQSKIEELATAGSNLTSLVEHLNRSEPVSDSAYWPALKELDSNVQDTFVPRSVPRSRDVSLKFLQPATDSAYLGRLSHFDVMRVLGRGGMGLVLEAFDSKLQRSVALKVLDPDLIGDETARQRFCREARAAASITHENVIAVHQVERHGDDGLPYLVMQLIPGESLEQRLSREKQLPLREIVRISMQATHGLEAAHAQGLIHRDIKPGNILLEEPHDRVKLTDFGLARAAEDVKLTRTGFVSGTPLYMAPEQAMGEDSDHRSDLFSLGAIMYEMCAGQPPFTGNSALAILKQIAESKHRPIRELNPAIPDWFADTIDRLLTKKAGDRIQSARQLAELLDFQWALMQTTSEDVPTICQIEHEKQQKRNRLIAVSIGVGFLTLGLIGGIFLANRPGTMGVSRSTAPPVAVLSANSGTVWSVAFNRTSDLVAMSTEDGSVRLWDVHSQAVKETIDDAHRGVIWGTRYSKSGDWLVTAGNDRLIKLWKQPMESEPTKVFEHPNGVRGMAISHDEKFLYGGDREGDLRVWSIADSSRTVPLKQTQAPKEIFSVVISPNDETLATAGADKVIQLWNAKTLSTKLKLEDHEGQVYGLSFNHDGRRLASGGWDKQVRIWDASSGQLIKKWDGKSGGIWSVAYSPDGERLATGGNDGSLKLWNAATGDLLANYLGHEDAVHSIAFNREGTLIASAGRDGKVRIWKPEPPKVARETAKSD